MLHTYLDKMQTKFRKVHFEFFVQIMARDRVKRKPIIATKQVITKIRACGRNRSKVNTLLLQCCALGKFQA